MSATICRVCGEDYPPPGHECFTEFAKTPLSEQTLKEFRRDIEKSAETKYPEVRVAFLRLFKNIDTLVAENAHLVNHLSENMGWKTIAEQHCRNEEYFRKERDQLREAVGIYDELIESGWLGRDTSRDHEHDWALKQLEPIGKLQRAKMLARGHLLETREPE